MNPYEPPQEATQPRFPRPRSLIGAIFGVVVAGLGLWGFVAAVFALLTWRDLQPDEIVRLSLACAVGLFFVGAGLLVLSTSRQKIASRIDAPE
jgi:hypothetical protein